ncbi:MAG TPA: energy transducer TonB [Pyrinomonadaceae bacterium]|jgi:outer membrane biosynthesis protein TonB
MKLIIVGLIQTFILLVCLVNFSKAQQNKQCDFSKYKPFTIVNLPSGRTINEVRPEYSPAAYRIGVSGQVVVIILVDRKGNVKKACSNVGHPLLRPAAIKAALKWKFKSNFGFDSKISSRYLQTYLSFDFKK